MNNTYAEIEIINENDLTYKGKIFINEDNYCEGIIIINNVQYFIFGYFKRLDNLELHLVFENSINTYVGNKAFMKYKGDCTCIRDNNIIYTHKFSLILNSLAMDPRDYDTNEEGFIDYLRIFKDKWLQDENNKKIYEEYFGDIIMKRR